MEIGGNVLFVFICLCFYHGKILLISRRFSIKIVLPVITFYLF